MAVVTDPDSADSLVKVDDDDHGVGDEGGELSLTDFEEPATNKDSVVIAPDDGSSFDSTLNDDASNKTPDLLEQRARKLNPSLSFLEKGEDGLDDDAEAKAIKQETGIVQNMVATVSLWFKKIDNRLQYLASLLIDNNPSLVEAFIDLQVTRIDQISLLEIWWTICKDRPKMSVHEFHKFYKLSEQPLGGKQYADRMFREINTSRGSDSGSLSFAHWATGIYRWCTYSYPNTLALAFRLMSRAGGTIDELGTLRGDGRAESDPCGDGRNDSLDPYDALKKKQIRLSTPQQRKAMKEKKKKNIKNGENNNKKYTAKVRDESLIAEQQYLKQMDQESQAMEPPAFDLTDLRHWYETICFEGYGIACVAPHRNDRLKSVMRFYGLMNLDDSGGVDLDEFAPFAWRNLGCLVLAHLYQERMRMVVFGKHYWEKRREARGGKLRKIRKLKAAKAKEKRLEAEELQADSHSKPSSLSHPTASAESPSQFNSLSSLKKSKGSPSRSNSSLQSFRSFREGNELEDIGIQRIKFQQGGYGIDIDGDDDAWQKALDEAVVVVRQVNKLKEIIQGIVQGRPKSSANIPGTVDAMSMNNLQNLDSVPSFGGGTTLPSSSVMSSMGGKSVSSVNTNNSEYTSQSQEQNGGNGSGMVLPSPTSKYGSGEQSMIKEEKSVQFAIENSNPHQSVHSDETSLKSNPYGSTVSTAAEKAGIDATLAQVAKAELSAKRKVEKKLEQIQKLRFLVDFPTVFAKAKWEADGKKKAKLGVTERTFRKAIPDTRWPVMRVKLNIEAFNPLPPPKTPPKTPQSRPSTSGSGGRFFRRRSIDSPLTPGSPKPMLSNNDEIVEIPSISINDEQVSDVNSDGIVVDDNGGNNKDHQVKKGGWFSRAGNVLSSAATSMGNTMASAGQTLTRLATPNQSKPKLSYRVKLTLNLELEDLAGEWPGGESIANRVLIAEKLKKRHEATIALKKTELKLEAHLLRLDRFNKNEYEGGLYSGCRTNLISGVGWDGGPMGAPWLPGGATSHVLGGTGAKEKELLTFQPHELYSDYRKARKTVKKTAKRTNGEARRDSALILKSKYREVVH